MIEPEPLTVLKISSYEKCELVKLWSIKTKANEWAKYKGAAILYVEGKSGEIVEAEIHWVDQPQIGAVDRKISGEFYNIMREELNMDKDNVNESVLSEPEEIEDGTPFTEGAMFSNDKLFIPRILDGKLIPKEEREQWVGKVKRVPRPGRSGVRVATIDEYDGYRVNEHKR